MIINIENLLKEEGFSMQRVLANVDDNRNKRFKKLEKTYYIKYKEFEILMIQDKDDGTFNTFELFKYPTSHSQNNFNVLAGTVIEIARDAFQSNYIKLVEHLTSNQIDLLRSRFATRMEFEVGDYLFNCDHGEWQVLKDNKHIDVFSFCRMSDSEFNQTLHGIFKDKEKVTIQ